MAKTYTQQDFIEMLRGKISYGYTQSDIAKDIGVHRSTISAIMSGSIPPSKTVLSHFGWRKDHVYVIDAK